jgi:hypothetical protein
VILALGVVTNNIPGKSSPLTKLIYFKVRTNT